MSDEFGRERERNVGAFVVVLFVLLIIVGCSCFNSY